MRPVFLSVEGLACFKEKQEIDFLVTRDGYPWLPVEARLSDAEPSPHWRRFLPALGCRRGVQVVATSSCFRLHPIEDTEVLVASADRVLDCLA